MRLNHSKPPHSSRLFSSGSGASVTEAQQQHVSKLSQEEIAALIAKRQAKQAESLKQTRLRAASQPELLQHVERVYEVGRRHVKPRQHVNPLASAHQKPIELDDNW